MQTDVELQNILLPMLTFILYFALKQSPTLTDQFKTSKEMEY